MIKQNYLKLVIKRYFDWNISLLFFKNKYQKIDAIDQFSKHRLIW